MNFDVNDPKSFKMFKQFVAIIQANGGQLPALPTAPVQAPLKVCPDIEEITLLQATFFNNGEKGERPKNTSQFKMTLEVWTEDEDDIRLSEWQWKRSCVLHEYWSFEGKLKKYINKGSISQEFFDEIMDQWKDMCPRPNSPIQPYFGMIGDKGDPSPGGKKGTNFYDRQFIVVLMENKKAEAMILYVNGETIDVADFSNKDMKGQPLSGNAKCQARVNRCGFHDNWAT